MVNLWRHKVDLEFQYKISAIVAFGLAIQSLMVFWRLSLAKSVGLRINVSRSLIIAFPVVTTSFLVWICLNQGMIWRIEYLEYSESFELTYEQLYHSVYLRD